MIGLRLGQQHTVGHDLDTGLGIGLVAEADFATDIAAVGPLQLCGYAAGDGEGGDAARLSDGDTGFLTSTCFEADFGQLSALSRAGFAGDDNDGVFLDCGEDLILVAADGQ